MLQVNETAIEKGGKPSGCRLAEHLQSRRASRVSMVLWHKIKFKKYWILWSFRYWQYLNEQYQWQTRSKCHVEKKTAIIWKKKVLLDAAMQALYSDSLACEFWLQFKGIRAV